MAKVRFTCVAISGGTTEGEVEVGSEIELTNALALRLALSAARERCPFTRQQTLINFGTYKPEYDADRLFDAKNSAIQIQELSAA